MTSVPEPSTLVLGALGILGSLVFWRRSAGEKQTFDRAPKPPSWSGRPEWLGADTDRVAMRFMLVKGRQSHAAEPEEGPTCDARRKRPLCISNGSFCFLGGRHIPRL